MLDVFLPTVSSGRQLRPAGRPRQHPPLGWWSHNCRMWLDVTSSSFSSRGVSGANTTSAPLIGILDCADKKPRRPVRFYIISRLDRRLVRLPPSAGRRRPPKRTLMISVPQGADFQHFPLHVVYSRIPFGDWDRWRGFLETELKKASRGSRHESLSQVLPSGLRKKAWVDYMWLFMWLHFPAALHEGSCILGNHGDEAFPALGRGLQGVKNGSNHQWCHTGSLLAQWCNKTKASTNPQHYAFCVVCTDAFHHIFWYILERNGIVKKKI